MDKLKSMNSEGKGRSVGKLMKYSLLGPKSLHIAKRIYNLELKNDWFTCQ